MSRPNPRPVPVALAVVLAVIVVAASVALVLRLTGDGDDKVTGSTDGATPTTPSTTPTTADPAPNTATTASSIPATALSPAQARTVDRLKAQVAEIRGLQWKADLPVAIVSPDELARRIRALTAIEKQRHPDDLAKVETVLKLFHLIPSDLNFEVALDKLFAGGVLGFYDDEAHELFVGGDPESDLDVATQSTMVHELTHALTDQHFDFGARNRALADADQGEESVALAAVVEGDAELVRTHWEDEHLTSRQRTEAAAGGEGPAVYQETPVYILQSLFFPYREGLDFVTAIHDEGGFAAVNTAYQQPPTSTEEILHPELYVPGRQWTRPALPDLAAATGCTAIDQATVGEFDMIQVLDENLSESEARTAAAGWNGDAYGLVRCGSAVGMADRWRSDSPADLDQLAESLGKWARGWSGSNRLPEANGSFSGPGGSGRIIRSADRIDLIIAEDASTSDRLSSAVLAA